MATHKDKAYLDSDQEEADTKILLHAVDEVSRSSRRTQTCLYWPLDVTRSYVQTLHSLPEEASATEISSFVQLSALKAQLERQHYLVSMPGTEPMSLETLQIKARWNAGKRFLKLMKSVSLHLQISVLPSFPQRRACSKLVCQLYQPKTKMSILRDLRWLLFRRKQAESERLPPTQAAFREAIKRSHYQAMIWANDKVHNPDRPSLENYGWRKDKGYYKLSCYSNKLSSSTL